ncbi:MAG TPA: hypothetical protein VGV59_04130 [Pyrinomonadaceae bacterium]|nr:hypothetical protein [Pyrinomonadaceae bacterium]
MTIKEPPDGERDKDEVEASRPGVQGPGLSDPAVQNLIVGIVTTLLAAQFAVVMPFWLRAILGALTLLGILIIARRLVLGAANLFRMGTLLLKNSWQFVLGGGITFGLMTLGIGLGWIAPEGVPREVLEARREIMEIDRALSEGRVKRWWAAEESAPGEPRRRLYMRDNEVVVAENLEGGGDVLRTYLKNGRRIAEDVRGTLTEGFARRYYRGECNFATDYYDAAERHLYLLYDADCRGRPQVKDISAPRLSVPAPVFTYR